MLGKRYGLLTVVAQVEEHREPGRHWLCRCDCGGSIVASTARLNKGAPTSCGCQRYPDLSGQVFGRLTVLRRSERRAPRGARTVPLWECRCECGNLTYKPTDALKNHDVSMCRACADKLHCSKAQAKAGYVSGTQLSKLRSERPNRSGKSGVRGVCFDTRSGKWRAHIKFRRKTIALGYYRELSDAIAARKRGEEEYFGAALEGIEKESG